MLSAGVRTVAVVAAACGLLAVAAPASAKGGKAVRVWQCTRGVVRPSKVFLGCASGAGGVDRIKYKSYGGKTAAASGRFDANNCMPDCASGHVSHYPVSLTFFQVVKCHDHHRYYSRLRYTFGGKPPSQYKKSQVAKIGPTASQESCTKVS